MRNMTPAMQAAITARLVVPTILADLTFKSGTEHIWTGIGEITWNGNVYRGVGVLGSIGTVSETTAVEALGTSVKLSGIDPELYAESMADIVTGLPAKIWLGCMSGYSIVGALLLFSGMIDQPTDEEDGDDISITIELETMMANLQRANRTLYTAAEQHRKYPNDTGFNFVTTLQNMANIWG